jgi:aspartate aminotransferase-like enzyme
MENGDLLIELEAEDGVRARNKRYIENQTTLVEGVSKIGFTPFVFREY